MEGVVKGKIASRIYPDFNYSKIFSGAWVKHDKIGKSQIKLGGIESNQIRSDWIGSDAIG